MSAEDETPVKVPEPKEVPSSDADDAEVNWELNRIILNYADPEDIPVKPLAEQYGISRQRVAGVIGGAMKSPKVYKRLIKAGYDDAQIPPWIPRESSAEVEATKMPPEQLGKAPGALKVPEPRGRPAPIQYIPPETEKVAEVAPPPAQQVPPSLTRVEQPGGTPSALSGAYDQEEEFRRNTQKLNIIKTSDGRWVQARASTPNMGVELFEAVGEVPRVDDEVEDRGDAGGVLPERVL